MPVYHVWRLLKKNVSTEKQLLSRFMTCSEQPRWLLLTAAKATDGDAESHADPYRMSPNQHIQLNSA